MSRELSIWGKWRALTCGGSTLTAWKESETSVLRCFCTIELLHNKDQACIPSTGEGNYSLQPFPVCSAVAQVTLEGIHILLNVLWWSLLWKIFGSTITVCVCGWVKVTHCLQVCFLTPHLAFHVSLRELQQWNSLHCHHMNLPPQIVGLGCTNEVLSADQQCEVLGFGHEASP